ncbi:MAG: CDGSH iron-sulfur domain-containing protein [Candidatus Sumerlaeia bacterium]|nr:CDGSH iron-sulfur domain-containing protein [Candidatus Sumerlaeia bacterium]
MAAKLTVKPNGSLRVEGEFELVDIEGNSYTLTPGTGISICRCGKTQKAPFCDGSHKTCGFESPSKAY